MIAISWWQAGTIDAACLRRCLRQLLPQGQQFDVFLLVVTLDDALEQADHLVLVLDPLCHFLILVDENAILEVEHVLSFSILRDLFLIV